MPEIKLGGQFTFPGTSLTVHRTGYGAMQLAGPGVWGPPKDPHGAVAVLRDAVAAGVNHIDTSDFYGPHVTNQIIRQALHPYPKGLVIVTKLGARRPPDGSWRPAFSREELIAGVHDDLSTSASTRSTSSTIARWVRFTEPRRVRSPSRWPCSPSCEDKGSFATSD